MDILFIEQLTVMATIGIQSWEKECFQKLIFNVELAYNNTCIKKDIGTCFYVDYIQVKKVILNVVNQKHFLLIEDVAEMTASALIQNFYICWVRITVKKPNAIFDAANVGICIKRRK